MSDTEDRNLLARHAAGDSRAFPALYRKYHRRVFGYCWRMLGKRNEIDDIVQAVFTRAFETVRSLDSPELFYYWLFSIARNEVLQTFRAAQRHRTQPLDEEVWDPETPFDKTVQREEQELVEEGISRLKPEYREVIVLRQFEGLSYAEIAAVTGDSLSSVESRLFKARKALVKLLEPVLREKEES